MNDIGGMRSCPIGGKMINRRLLQLVPESNKFIAFNVLAKWISLVMIIIMISSVSMLIASLTEGEVTDDMVVFTALTAISTIVIRAFCIYASSGMGYLASTTMKKRLREKIFSKLLRLGIGYRDEATTSEVIQLSVEGVDSLDTYYSAYLPQLFYSILAPITLTILISRYNMECAILLLVFVPIVPTVLVLVRMRTKGMMSEYWSKYAGLGDMFLESLQAMTAFKIYQSDADRNRRIDEQSEEFSQSCKGSLRMQLGSVSAMDIIAYGGSALGMVMAVLKLQSGEISLEGCLVIMFLSVEFFLPMRRLGTMLQSVMKGAAVCDRIFDLLDLPEPERKGEMFPLNVEISIDGLGYSYGDRQALKDVSLELDINSLTAIVGESGCGKSTFASVLTGRLSGYQGSIRVGRTELSEINDDSLMQNITYVDHRSHIFKGTVRDNLTMGSPDAEDDELWDVLSKLGMDSFVKSIGGLDTMIAEGATNMSGGQRQRLAVARALLHRSAVYVFDECTSNVDPESESIILERIRELAEHRIVLLISHRLANVTMCDRILVMENGRIVGSGSHDELLSGNETYREIWDAQSELESYGKEAVE